MISFLLLSYNSAAHLPALFESLRQQSNCDFEVLALDNASSDTSFVLLRESGVVSRATKSSVNLGYAKGMNELAGQSKGDLLVPLNADTILDKDFVLQAEKIAREDASKSVLSPLVLGIPDSNRVDAGVIRVSLDMRSRHYRDQEQSQGQGSANTQVSTKAAGPCPVIPLAILKILGTDQTRRIFDDVLFHTYGEDIDFALRCIRADIPVLFCRELKAYHYRSGSSESGAVIGKRGWLRSNILEARYINLMKHLPLPAVLGIGLILLLEDCAYLAKVVAVTRSTSDGVSAIYDLFVAHRNAARKLQAVARYRRQCKPGKSISRRLAKPSMRLARR